MKNKQIFLLALVIFIVPFVSASYTLFNHTLQDQYSKGSFISGNLDISFQNEPINSVFTDSFQNKVTLQDLIINSKDYSYVCEYPNCESKFKEVNLANLFSFNLNKGEEAFYGIVFDQNLTKINSMSFDLESDAKESPTSQISVDFLNDGVIDLENTKVGNKVSENKNFGCFNSSKKQTELFLTSTPYCQEVFLNESPGARIGAWVKEVTASPVNISMTLFDGTGDLVGGCLLSKNYITGEGNVTFCDINKPIKNENYYVCIGVDGAGEGNYKTRGHSQKNNCGFQGTPIKSPVYSYQIGAIQKYFGNVGTLTISNALPNGKNLSKMVEDYIFSKYGGLDCSLNKCYIPIRIISSMNQSILLKNLNVNYDFVGGSVAINEFSKFEEDSSKINASRGKLSFGQFFKLPNEEKNLSYKLYYKGKKLFSEKISIKDFKINLYPKKVAVSFPSNFFLYLPKELNPSVYKWDFGDGQFKITSEPNVKHTYLSKGDFTLKLIILTKVGKISKVFNIKVGSAKEILKSEIEKRKKTLKEFEKFVANLDDFEKSQVEKVVDLFQLRKNLSLIEGREKIAISDEDYNKIISEFLSLRFPSYLQNVKISKSFINPLNSEINLEPLKALSKRKYNDSKKTYDYIKFWNLENLNTDVEQNKILIGWEDGKESDIQIFDLSIIPSKGINEDYYLFVRDVGNLEFKDNSRVKKVEGYKYVKLNDRKESFTFSVEQNFPIEDYLFISPSNITIVDFPKVQEAKSKTWIIYLGLIGVFLIGLLIYLMVQRWYKLKYEKYLFPDKNQLYNAIIYINNSRKGGMEEEEIRKNLIKVGWKREQVSYLLKKYSGKRTGMVDIFGFFKKKETFSDPPNPGRNVEFKSSQDTKFNK